jgi:hypothetical protein
MKLQRFLLLGLMTAAVAACSDDSGPTTTTFAPSAAVRFVHAAPDTGALEIRWTDQLSGSPYYGQFTYRYVSNYQAVEVANGTRTFRVFPATNNNIAVVTQIVFEGSLPLTANNYYTVILHGPARAGNTGITVLDDTPGRTPPPSGQIAFKAINTSDAPVDVRMQGLTVPLTDSTRVFANVGPRSQTGYATMPPVTTLTARVTAPGSMTVLGSANAPPGAPPASSSQTALGGSTIQGSMLSAFVFPPSVAGSGAPSVTTYSVVWIQDNRP